MFLALVPSDPNLLSINQATKKPTLPPVPVVANTVRQFFSPGAIAIITPETNVATNQDLNSDRVAQA